jgi:hypothetical protein
MRKCPCFLLLASCFELRGDHPPGGGARRMARGALLRTAHCDCGCGCGCGLRTAVAVVRGVATAAQKRVAAAGSSCSRQCSGSRQLALAAGSSSSEEQRAFSFQRARCHAELRHVLHVPSKGEGRAVRGANTPPPLPPCSSAVDQLVIWIPCPCALPHVSRCRWGYCAHWGYYCAQRWGYCAHQVAHG